MRATATTRRRSRSPSRSPAPAAPDTTSSRSAVRRRTTACRRRCPDLVRGDASLADVTSWARRRVHPGRGDGRRRRRRRRRHRARRRRRPRRRQRRQRHARAAGLGNDSCRRRRRRRPARGRPRQRRRSRAALGDDTLSGGPSEQPTRRATTTSSSATPARTRSPVTSATTSLFGDDGVRLLRRHRPTLGCSPATSADWATCACAGGRAGHDDRQRRRRHPHRRRRRRSDRSATLATTRPCGCDGERPDRSATTGDDELHGDADDDTHQRRRRDDDVIRGGSRERRRPRRRRRRRSSSATTGADLLFGDDGDDIVVGDTGSVDRHAGVRRRRRAGPRIDPAKALAMDATVDHSHGGTGARRRLPTALDRAAASATPTACSAAPAPTPLFGAGDGDIIARRAGVDLLVGDDGNDLIRGGTDIDCRLRQRRRRRPVR